MAVQPKIFEDLEGPDFVRSSDVEAVGEKVLDLHGGIGGVARLYPIAEAIRDGELSILWLMNEKPFNDETEDDQEPEIAGRCVKAPRLWHDVTGHHFAIWIRFQSPAGPMAGCRGLRMIRRPAILNSKHAMARPKRAFTTRAPETSRIGIYAPRRARTPHIRTHR